MSEPVDTPFDIWAAALMKRMDSHSRMRSEYEAVGRVACRFMRSQDPQDLATLMQLIDDCEMQVQIFEKAVAEEEAARLPSHLGYKEVAR